MKRLVIVLSALAVAGLCGCAGAYVAGDLGAGHGSPGTHTPAR